MSSERTAAIVGALAALTLVGSAPAGPIPSPVESALRLLGLI